jgi:hypothetical protein
MSHVSVAWQRPGWNVNIFSGILALWAECHISPCLYSSLYLYNHVKEGNETIPFIYTYIYIHTNIHAYIHFYIDRCTVRIRNTVSNNTPIFICVFTCPLPMNKSDIISTGRCLPSRYQATHVPYRDHCIATVLHITI